MTRRNFLATAAAGLAAQTPAPRSTVCFFSKHLPELKYDELGKWLRDGGFDGVDLTVRPEVMSFRSAPLRICRAPWEPSARTDSKCR